LVNDSIVSLKDIFRNLTSVRVRLPNRLIPRSHKFQTHFTLSLTATEFMAFRENYQQPARSLGHSQQSRRILKWLIANRFSYQQVIHSLLHCKHQRYLTCVSIEVDPSYRSTNTIPSQCNLVDRRIYNSVQVWSAIPLSFEAY
jgi:hypothetical protein